MRVSRIRKKTDVKLVSQSNDIGLRSTGDSMSTNSKLLIPSVTLWYIKRPRLGRRINISAFER